MNSGLPVGPAKPDGSRLASWQRFIDTGDYMFVATEELCFSNKMDWSC